MYQLRFISEMKDSHVFNSSIVSLKVGKLL